jgi:hypothetical protein
MKSTIKIQSSVYPKSIEFNKWASELRISSMSFNRLFPKNDRVSDLMNGYDFSKLSKMTKIKYI